MHVLFEHASGYVLVHCEETDDINELKSGDWATFSQQVKLKAFKPFTSAANALDNMNAISEGNKAYLKTVKDVFFLCPQVVNLCVF